MVTKKTRPKVEKPVEPKKKALNKVIFALEVNGQRQEVSGASLVEALQNIILPTFIKTKVVAEFNGKRIFLQKAQAHRAFRKELGIKLLAKRLGA